MDVGQVGKIAVCCRIRPPKTTDSRSSSSSSSNSDTSQSRDWSRVSSRGSTPIEIDNRSVHLKPAYAALAEHNNASNSSGGGSSTAAAVVAAAAAAGRLSAGARGGRRRRGSWGFTFDDVIEEGCQQDEVYRRCAKCIVDSALVGLNGTVMAYGCTGAGKSYTMMGERGGDDKRRGICARALQDILREATRRRKNEAFTIQMSFVEIYNEQLFDLLRPEMCPSQRRFSVYGGSDSAVGKRSAAPAVHVPGEHPTTVGGGGSRAPTREKTPQQPDLAIYERPDGSTYVKGLSLLPVSTEEEAMRMLRIGQTAREVGENQFNHASSRSHAVLTVHIAVRKKKGGELEAARVEGGGGGGGGGAMTSKLNLVDLAGSEKSTTGASAGGAATLDREGCYINKSLTFLEQVTIALADKTREHVPFRQSKLTHMLKDSLGGNCRTLLVACVWPRPELLVQSLATLKFAARMRGIKNAPVVNERPCSMDEELSRLRWQVRQLKAEVALKDDSGAGFASMSPTQRRRVWEQAGRFVLEGSERASMRAKADNIKTRERSVGEGGEQGETDSEDAGGSDASEALHRGCSKPPDTTITDGPHGDAGAVLEKIAEDGGNCSEWTNMRQERGNIDARRQHMRRQLLSGTPPASASALVSSPPERQERLFPSLSTARHAHELCLALREFVWEAAVSATKKTTTEPLRERKSITATVTNNNNVDEEDNFSDKDEHENTAGGAHPSRKTEDDKEGVCSSAAAAATVRSAVHAAIEGSNSSVVEQESQQQGGGGEYRRLKKSGRRRRPPAAYSAAEEAKEWVPRAKCLRRGGQETDDARAVATESPHLPQAGERLVRSTPLGVAKQTIATASPRERGVVRRPRVRGGDACGISYGSFDEPNAERFPISTRDEGRVDGGDADDLGGAFERFKHGPGRDVNDRLQNAKAAVKRGRAFVNDISGRINVAKGRIDHARVQLQWQDDEGGAELQPSSDDNNQSAATHSSHALRSASPPYVALSEGTRETKGGERRSGGREENNRQKLLLLAAVQLKEQKREYRDLFEKLAKAKAALRGFRQNKQQALSTLVTEFQKEQQEGRRKADFFLPPLSGTDQQNGTETTTTTPPPTTDGSGAGSSQSGGASAVSTPTKNIPTDSVAAALVQRAVSS